ncbi:hypothetical protein [Fusibacter sp. 3D3]|uniref:hypothetical protein n=1 Tax=Fusibacter sp. 3D3 TaxID=1048380 RepID=UPI000853DE1E|nr:hypothetical protein [Fusibacter sp. 3D3]GAU76407.1 putative transmembrane region [Fusibacter sp. 3D3]
MGKSSVRPVRACALCGNFRELEESHIIPKFVMRHLKKTAHGEIRSIENPNAVIQDSEKHYMLCGECEDLFSKKETKFANHFFYPYQKNSVKEFDYDEDLYYLLTSISWRSLYQDILDFVQNPEQVGIDLDTLNCFIEKESEIKKYLLGKTNNVEGIENHIFFFDDIKEFSNMPKEVKPHSTFHRGETSYTFFNKTEGTLATITNMMGIVLFTLYKKGKLEVWENTQIINGIGRIEALNQIIQSVCGNELIDIMNRVKGKSDNLSEKQKEKIIKRIDDDLEGFIKSESFEAIQKDAALKKD